MYLHPVLIILLIGLLYILGFGALSYVRRQGLSVRFALEGLIVTAACAVFSYVVVPVYPPIFLVIIYLITMRVRLLADVGNWLTASRRYEQALNVYQFALRLGPDVPSRQVVLINRGVTQLYMQAPEAAVVSLEEALATEEDRLGLKYLAAGHYNLGLAYRRIGREAEAVRHFNQAIDAWPMSVYAAHADAALKKPRRGDDEGQKNAGSD